MSKKFSAPNKIFVYPYTIEKGKKWTIRPGDKLIVNGKQITATIEYVNKLYSIFHRESIDEKTYEENKDCLFEAKKLNYYSSNDDHDFDPIEELPDMNVYTAHTINGRHDIYMEKGELTTKMSAVLSIFEEIKLKLTPSQVDLIYDLYGRNMGFTELAEEQGTSPQAIWGRDKRLRSTVEKLLASYGIDKNYFENL